MAKFQIETKNKIDIGKKPRVYFTCHPQDFEKYFRRICDDIFVTQDCAICYTEDMSEKIPEEEMASDLGRNNLFVIPVTNRLLTTSSRAMDVDLPYALKNSIPVLPIMMEPNLDVLYSKPDKFHKLQYLNPCSTDSTEIPYAEKLKKHLESVLIGNEMAEQIRDAFDAHIFLSYRKKDRRFANELMRLIHSNPECRNIAIWFDEFLTPGESFKESIETMLNDCNLFTLLVTPRLLEKVINDKGEETDNYVLSNELPLARRNRAEKGTDILAVEMEHTDKAELEAIQIMDYVNCRDEAFRARLLDSIARVATNPSDSPEHNFLIGLAYRDGIDVEVNREYSLALIESAADMGLPEAMLELSYMYRYGVGVAADYKQALIWIERLSHHIRTHRGEENPEALKCLYAAASICTEVGEIAKAYEMSRQAYRRRSQLLGEEASDTLRSMSQLAIICLHTGRYVQARDLAQRLYEIRSREPDDEKKIETVQAMVLLARALGYTGAYAEALEYLKKAYPLQCWLLGAEDPATLVTLADQAYNYCNLGQHREAIALNKRVYDVQRRKLGEEDPETFHTLNNLAYDYSCAGDYQNAMQLYKKAYDTSCKVLGAEHPDTVNTLNNLAAVYKHAGHYSQALELYQKVYALRCKTLGEHHPASLGSLNNIADLYSSFGNHKKALSMHKQVYALRSKNLGGEHPDTLNSLNNLAYVHGQLGDHKKALELNKETYALRCKVLGEEHPETLTSLNNLAHCHDHLRDYEKAISLEEQAYERSCKVLGEEHPDTLTALNSLGHFHQNAGNAQKAFELGEKAYRLRSKVLGAEHPNTLISLHNLSYAYANLGNPAKALEAEEQAYRLSCRTQGPAHPNTALFRISLSARYLAAGDFAKAQALLAETQSLEEQERKNKKSGPKEGRNKKK